MTTRPPQLIGLGPDSTPPERPGPITPPGGTRLDEQGDPSNGGDAEHRIIAAIEDGFKALVEKVDIFEGRLLAVEGSQRRTHDAVAEMRDRVEQVALRVGAVETKKTGISGAMAAVTAANARASQTEEAIVEQLRNANDQLRAERDARIAEDKRRLDAEIEADRTRRAWVTRAVVFFCGAGGLALIGLAGRACGG